MLATITFGQMALLTFGIPLIAFIMMFIVVVYCEYDTAKRLKNPADYLYRVECRIDGKNVTFHEIPLD